MEVSKIKPDDTQDSIPLKDAPASGSGQSPKALVAPSNETTEESQSVDENGNLIITSKWLRVLKSMSNTPVLLLQVFFLWWIFVLVITTPTDLPTAFAKAMGMAFFVGSVHCTNGYFIWAHNQRSFASLSAQLRSKESPALVEEDVEPDTSLHTYIKGNFLSLMRFYIAPVCVSTYSFTMSDAEQQFTFIFPENKIWHFSSVEIGCLICFAYFILMKWLEMVFFHTPKRKKKKAFSWQRFILDHTSIGYMLLWTIFIFWGVALALRSTISTLEKWPTAIGLACLVGMVLNVNAFAMFKSNLVKTNAIREELGQTIEQTALVRVYWNLNSSSAMRFFLIPFAVSTYTITANGNGESFTYIFPTGTMAGVLPDMLFIGIILLVFITTSCVLRQVALRSLAAGIKVAGNTASTAPTPSASSS